jgi:hypothetical protein
MNREAIWGWASRDPSVRWGAGAAVVVLWIAVAWADVRILLGLPLVGGVLGVLYYRRRDAVAAAAEDEDWF